MKARGGKVGIQPNSASGLRQAQPDNLNGVEGSYSRMLSSSKKYGPVVDGSKTGIFLV